MAKPQTERMIATVQPYTTTSIQLITDDLLQDPIDLKSAPLTLKATQSLTTSTCTQTDEVVVSSSGAGSNDHHMSSSSSSNHTADTAISGDLCAEIQKLNTFRKKIENKKTIDMLASATSPNSLTSSVSSSIADERQLQYYKDRCAILENKMLVYESTGDQQTRHLTDRLQREVQLESWLKQLNDRVQKLSQENARLTEERCELEEAENDTRLQLQRLQMELEIRTQRDQEMDALRGVAKVHANCLTDCIAKCQERIYILEEHRKDVQTKLEMLAQFMPTIVMLNSCRNGDDRNGKPTTLGIHRCQPQHIPSMCLCIQTYADSTTDDGEKAQYDRLCELLDDEKELKQSIAEIMRTYTELLENVDYLWPQIEKEYKDKIAESETEVHGLQQKIGKMEERLRQDTFCALERISLLEESESSLQTNLAEVQRDRKLWSDKCHELIAEVDAISAKYTKLQQYVTGPAAESLKEERKKFRTAEQELRAASETLTEMRAAYAEQMTGLQKQLQQTEKELSNIAVSNGELKEEVATLEHRCLELYQLRAVDADTIKHMSDELRFKYEQLSRLSMRNRSTAICKDGEPLADEMGYVLRSTAATAGGGVGDKTIA